VGRAASPRPDHDGAAPRPSSSKGSKSADGEKKKVKKKKSTPPVAPLSLGMPMVQNTDELPADQARQQLGELQKKYGALIVNFNNQQAELAASLKRTASLENEVAALKEQLGGSGDQQITSLQRQLQDSVQELRQVEAMNMTLQKKVNTLQVEHVSEEEVDQLFYALEIKDQQLAQAQKDKAGLEAEVLTARQLTARGTNYEPKFIEIHHHNTLSDDESSDDDDDFDDSRGAE
jgi:hypothetical protein